MHMCYQHPKNQATYYCMQCRRPMCRSCVMQTGEGIFCSMFCAEEASDFRGKLRSGKPISLPWRMRFSRIARSLLLILIILGVCYLALALSGGSIIEQIKSLLAGQ